MRKALFLFLVVILSACTLIQRKVEVLPWPSDVTSLDGEGDLDLRTPKEHFSGSFIVSMSYPGKLFLEVYGSFGQTLVHLQKEGDRFLFISGDERTNDEKALLDRFGFTTKELMDDLAVRGEKRETAGGWVTERRAYAVVYGNDRRGRKSVCWERRDGRLCLVFNDVNFGRGQPQP